MGSYANICDKRINLPGPQKPDMVSCDTKVLFPNHESCEAEDELDCDIKKTKPSNIFYDWESIFAERRKQKEKEEKIIREEEKNGRKEKKKLGACKIMQGLYL